MQASASGAVAREVQARRPVYSQATSPSQDDTSIVTVQVARPAGGFSTLVIALLIVAALFLGWQAREDSSLTPEEGLGYALGITGGSLMLILLLYPLRKRVRAMRTWMPVKYWFNMHMLFGTLGPVLVIFHSNFSLGSTNGTVALISMVVVALSGVVGRYLYARIHCGLYGHRVNLSHFRLGEKVARVNLAPILVHSPALEARLSAFEAAVRVTPTSLLNGIWRGGLIVVMTRWTYWRARRDLKAGLKLEARCKCWSPRERRKRHRRAKRQLATYLATVRQTAEFSFYERLFALWHVLHLPLFVLLVVTGIVHVVAVHMY